MSNAAGPLFTLKKALRIPAHALSQTQLAPQGQVVIAQGTYLQVFEVKSGQLKRILLSSSGKILDFAVSPSGVVAMASNGGAVTLWNAGTGVLLRSLNVRATAVAFDGKGTQLFTASPDASVQVWDAQTGQSLRHFETGVENITRLRFSADGQRLAVGGETLTVLDPLTGKVRFTLETEWPVQDLQFDPSGEVMGFLQNDPYNYGSMSLIVASGKDGQILHEVHLDDNPFYPGSAFTLLSPSEALIREDKNTLITVDLRGQQKQRSMVLGDTKVESLGVSGQTLLVGQQDGGLLLYDLKSRKALQTVYSHSDQVIKAEFSRDGSAFLTVGNNNHVKVWDSATLKPRFEYTFKSSLWDAFLSGDGRYVLGLVFHVDEGFLEVVDTQTGEEVYSEEEFMQTVVAGSDPSLIWSLGAGVGIQRWTLPDFNSEHILDHPDWGYTAADLSTDQNVLVAGTTVGTVMVWDLQQNLLLTEKTFDEQMVLAVSLLAQKDLVLITLEEQGVLLWNLRTQEVQNLPEDLKFAQFSPSGDLIAGITSNNQVVLLDPMTFEVQQKIEGFSGPLTMVKFDPSGQCLITDAGTFEHKSSANIYCSAH